MMPVEMKPERGHPQKLKGRHHPAFGYTLTTLVLLGGLVVFGFITVFIPWAMVDIGVGQRAWAYPFKTCIEDTFSDVNAEFCADNDFIEPDGVPVTGRTEECMGFILATIAFVFISVLLGLLIGIWLIWILVRLWDRPYKQMIVFNCLNFLVWWAAMLAWIMFICYAENECVPDSFFPVHGYSYGFVMYVFASAFGLASVITAFLALLKIKKFQPEEQLYPVEGYAQESIPFQATYPGVFPPAVYPATTYPGTYPGMMMGGDQVLTSSPVFPPVFL